MQGAFELIHRARSMLGEAAAATSPDERFRLAHLAALRTAAAVVAACGRPARARRRLVNVWVLLATVAPEYQPWADRLAAGAPARAAIDAGAGGVVDPAAAAAVLRAAERFLVQVEDHLGLLAAPLAS